MRNLILATVLFLMAPGCSKSTQASVVDADVEIAIYRLTSYQNMPGECRIDPASARLSQDVFISGQDIVSYDSLACIYTLTDDAMQKMKALPGGEALAITINKEVIYYFLNMPFTTNHICRESVVISLGLGNGMPLRLGYPAYPEPDIQDPRNDKRLMAALKIKGKL